jgi:hypothetical protein
MRYFMRLPALIKMSYKIFDSLLKPYALLVRKPLNVSENLFSNSKGGHG